MRNSQIRSDHVVPHGPGGGSACRAEQAGKGPVAGAPAAILPSFHLTAPGPRFRAHPLLLALLALATAGPVAAGEPVAGEDLVRAAPELAVAEPVPGDLLAAGGRIRLEAPVTGGAVVAGGEVRSTGRIGNNLVVAGGRVVVEAPVADTLAAAGGQITLGPAASVGGNAYLAGGELRVSAPVEGSLAASAGRVELAAPVRGRVELRAGEAVIRSSARVGGHLLVYSPRPPIIEPGAEIAGGTRYVSTAPPPGARFVGWFWSLLMLLATGLLMLALFRRWPVRVAQTLEAEPLAAVLIGLVAAGLTPLLAVMLGITVLGLPAGLTLLGAYLTALYLGPILAAFGVTWWALRRWRTPEPSPWSAMALGLLIYAVIRTIPLLGWLVVLLAVAAGLGAALLERWRWMRPAPAPVLASPTDGGLSAAPGAGPA